MFKKFLFTAVFMAVSNVVLAGTAFFSPDLVLNAVTSKYANFTGLNLRLAFGYTGMLSQNFFLTGEVFGTPGVVTIQNNRGVGQSVKTTWNFGVSILPGVYLNQDTMGYLRIGALDAHFDSVNTSTPAMQFGIGLAAEVDQQFNVGLEYSYVAYRSMKGIGSPKSSMYSLSFVRKFNL